jgi:hypothetical protein
MYGSDAVVVDAVGGSGAVVVAKVDLGAAVVLVVLWVAGAGGDCDADADPAAGGIYVGAGHIAAEVEYIVASAGPGHIVEGHKPHRCVQDLKIDMNYPDSANHSWPVRNSAAEENTTLVVKDMEFFEKLDVPMVTMQVLKSLEALNLGGWVKTYWVRRI